MSWYYADRTERRGPVEQAALLELLEKRLIGRQTLVWREGMPDWVPLEEVHGELTGAPGTGTGAALVAPEQRCIECGLIFPENDLARINQLYVCAGCKGILLQKLAQGHTPGSAGTLFRKGRQVVAPLEAFFPERCVKCDAPGAGRQFKRRLYWHHPAFYVMILFPGLLFYLVAAMIARKRATVHVSLCAIHRARRARTILIAWLLFALGLGLIVLSIYLGSANSAYVGAAIIAAACSIVAAIIVGLIVSQIVKPAKIDLENAYLTGAGENFLAQLPSWPEP